MSSNNYVVLNPYVFDPHFTLDELSLIRLHPTHITADSPALPTPTYARTTINSHLTTLTRPTAAAAAPHDYESDTETLVLDADILERHPTTHVIGECGRRGCRISYGCIFCAGDSSGRSWDRSLDPTPRTHFRNAVAMALGGAVPSEGVGESGEVGGERGEGYPTHLQRMEGPIKRGRKPGSGVASWVGQGPRIKYCKRRAEVEQKVDDAVPGSEGTIVVKKPHKSKAQLAALERRRRAPVRKKG
ncbi:uncharacterized protein H6S33_006519 [Morchella sextelata]|uniref:uncharacterized protein n=1 Tax=Morchella sextelata TaxID=1174677 RepID=UPI001D04C82A|nr:uncharacterized protein H6S33_006519 [Morchella sextelata]KAH0604851.1 hypothetical protein H6S33_006519 [Morchella sextelata]